MAESRTVRARVDDDLAGRVDAAMEHEERTESDIVRRALRAYLKGFAPLQASVVGGKQFKGPDPK